MFTSLALSLIFAGAGEQPASRLAVIRKAPDFTLVNQDEKNVKLSDYKGKVLLVSFVFTTCNGSCPATTHRMAKVYDEVNKHGLVRQATQFVTITLDPKRDTPEALRNYIKLFDLDPKGWTFFTGPVEEVEKTIGAWNMWAKPAANGQIDHPSRIFLVDKQFQVREIYNVELLKTDDVFTDICQLVAEGWDLRGLDAAPPEKAVKVPTRPASVEA